jgi:hypothetical protein
VLAITGPLSWPARWQMPMTHFRVAGFGHFYAKISKNKLLVAKLHQVWQNNFK